MQNKEMNKKKKKLRIYTLTRQYLNYKYYKMLL